jgi:endonuclease/exonuclease/phosphatase family metal-dependent hydrolase
VPTYPSRWPLLPLDRIYARGAQVQSVAVPPRGEWARWSDHLPLVAEVELA